MVETRNDPRARPLSPTLSISAPADGSCVPFVPPPGFLNVQPADLADVGWEALRLRVARAIAEGVEGRHVCTVSASGR